MNFGGGKGNGGVRCENGFKTTGWEDGNETTLPNKIPLKPSMREGHKKSPNLFPS